MNNTLYKIIFENEKGIIFKTEKYDKECKNICFVHHTSYERYKQLYDHSNYNKKNSIKISSLEDLYELIVKNMNRKTFGLKIKPEFVYLPKRENNNTIDEHAENLVNGLKSNNINNIKLISISYGCLIAALTTKYDIVKSIVVFQSPFWGTPMADMSQWNNMNKNIQKYLKKRYKKSVYLDDLKNGLNNKWNLVDKSKIIFIYGYSTHTKGILSFHNRKFWVPEIKKITQMDNDAVVQFPSKEIIDNMGFKKVIYIDNLYHANTLLKKYHRLMIKEIKS